MQPHLCTSKPRVQEQVLCLASRPGRFYSRKVSRWQCSLGQPAHLGKLAVAETYQHHNLHPHIPKSLRTWENMEEEWSRSRKSAPMQPSTLSTRLAALVSV